MQKRMQWFKLTASSCMTRNCKYNIRIDCLRRLFFKQKELRSGIEIAVFFFPVAVIVSGHFSLKISQFVQTSSAMFDSQF